METETKTPKKRLKLIQKIGYGVGDFGSNYCWTFVASFVLLYFTNVLGLNSAIIGTLMLVARVLDGVTDVLMGTIIDRTRSKMGKARFWYFVSAFPTAFFVFLLFNVPAGFNENTKYIYIFIVYVLLGAVFYTMSNIAYSTMSALVTDNSEERVQLSSYRYIFAIIAAVLISYTTSNLVEFFGGGQTGWRVVSILYAVICLVTLLVPFFAVRELPPEELNSTSGGFNALLAEADDYSYLKLGKRVTGSIYSCVSMGIKVGTGLGTALCGFILEFSHYDGTLAVQSQATQTAIMNAYFLPYIISSLVSVVLLFFFDVEKQNKKLRAEAAAK